MTVALSLVVLRCSDIAASKRFYEALGLELRAEQHGSGPAHWSCDLGELVLELYPADHRGPSVGRLGFATTDLSDVLQRLTSVGGQVIEASTPGRAVVVDPDGTRIELTERPRVAEPMTWNVWRQDDNGNRAVISRRHSRDEAERLVKEYEARGHKQMYWVSAEDL